MPDPPSTTNPGGPAETPAGRAASSDSGLAHTLFRRTLAASGLLDGLALHRVGSQVAARHPRTAEEQDRLYAGLLIKSGQLNAWQVDQLSQGRSKFRLGPYRILDAIGSGGMGHVFKAEHELLGRVEAVKVLPRHRSTPEAIAGFRHEIRAQAKLDHPNLVRVSYADRDGDTYFLVTEYVEGIDLRRLIRRRGEPLPEGAAAYVVRKSAEALAHAHASGLVHRDVKPGNVLTTRTGDVKVIDLGLAWVLDDENGSGGAPHGRGKIVGTSDYLAPEAIRKPGLVSPASDLYALGCSLYYVLTGKVPFPGGNHLDKMRRQINEEPTPPERLNDRLSPAALSLLTRMMAKDPAQRVATAEEAAEALKWLHGEDAAEQVGALVGETLDKPAAKRPASREAAGLPETIGLPAAAAEALLGTPPSAGQETDLPDESDDTASADGGLTGGGEPRGPKRGRRPRDDGRRP